MSPKKQKLEWKVHTPRLFKEIVECSPDAAIMRQPLRILGDLLFKVGERARELNDPQLNALMCRLTIYSVADPYSPDHDPKRVRRILAEAAALEKHKVNA